MVPVTIAVVLSCVLCTFQTHMKTISMLTQLLSNSVPAVLPQVVLEKREGSIHEGQIKSSELCPPFRKPTAATVGAQLASGGCGERWLLTALGYKALKE